MPDKTFAQVTPHIARLDLPLGMITVAVFLVRGDDGWTVIDTGPENHEKVVMDAVIESDGVYPAGVIDTGVPCAIAAQFIASGIIEKSGVYAPESIIEPELFFKELGKRGIMVLKNGKKVNHL